MFENLDDFISHDTLLKLDKSGRPTSFELQAATVALLVAMAHSDGLFSPSEKDGVLKAACGALGVEGEDAGELMELAVMLQSKDSTTSRFIAAINENFLPEQKEELLSLVWKVLISDGSAQKPEADFAATLRRHLGLSMEQAVRARLHAEEELRNSKTPSKQRREQTVSAPYNGEEEE